MACAAAVHVDVRPVTVPWVQVVNSAAASDSGVQPEADGKTVWFELVVSTGAGTASVP